ncbi:MAG TPA: protein kinase, partial [Kofleriaceae bacterium]|nr:protein kinase [Kofleriaceae bacterium]
AYAHRRTSNDGASLNLVHCDISPPNVLVSFEGETKVIDFGIAKSAIRGTATDPKMGFGKFGYMAPEQLIRGGVVDHRTDIYAAGVVLFELLTSKRLYEAGPEPDYRALAKKVAKGDHMLPSDVDKVLAPYDDLVATALRPKSEDRYQSAAELRDSIQQCLVSVNPTISTDQLGAYMRDLFSEEMTAQRELHERIAKAHLEDFHDQLTTQTGTTVSFAFANMPLPAPPEVNAAHAVPAPPVLPRTTTPQPPQRTRAPTAPTDMLPQQPAQPPSTPTAAVPTQEIDLADGTGAAELLPDSYVESLRPNHKRVVGIVIGAAALVIGVVVFAMTRGNHASAAATVAKTDPPKPHVTVESLPPEQPDPPKATAPVITTSGSADAKMEPPQAPVTQAPVTTTAGTGATNPPSQAKTVKQTHVQQVHKQPHKQTEIAAPKVTLTRDAVAAKFSAVKREYDSYKSKNGGRLDGDWGDLAMFVQYHMNDSTLDDVAHRIEAFRAKLRE